MGKRGTDVAREAAAIVLVEDDFGAIVVAIRLGRRIYDNIRKAIGFIFAVHVPIAGLALSPLLLVLPLVRGTIDRKSVGSGQRVSVREALGGRRHIKKKTKK